MCAGGRGEGGIGGERVMTLKRRNSQTPLLKSHQTPLGTHKRHRRPLFSKGVVWLLVCYGEHDRTGDDSVACLSWEDTY